MDLEALRAAGLYDPDAPQASERRTLLEHLTSQGVTIEQMQAAASRGALHSAASDIEIRPGRPVSASEVAARVGVTEDMLRRVTVAAGVPIADDDYRESDFTTFRLFAVGASMFGEDATIQFTRVVGSSMARVAEAAISLFLVNVEGPLQEAGATERQRAAATESAVTTLGEVPEIMDGLFRLQVQAAIRRQRIAGRAAQSPDTYRLAVGFVDLVGFTPLAQDMPAQDLVDLVEDFEARANDVVVTLGGRPVKHIGDEVMFVAVDAADACEIALRLVEGFKSEAGAPHAGVGFGLVIARGGDYYGPVVNVASRIADLAVPGEVLVTEQLRAAAAAAQDVGFEAAGRRMLKGFADPMPLWSVTRSPLAP